MYFQAGTGSALGYDTVINIKRSFRFFVSWLHTADGLDVVSSRHTFDGVAVTVHRKNSWVKEASPVVLRPAIYLIHGGGWVYEFSGNKHSEIKVEFWIEKK